MAGHLTVEDLFQQTELKFVPDHPEWSYELRGNDSHLSSTAQLVKKFFSTLSVVLKR